MLIERHGARVLALLVRLLGDRHQAEDVYQETWTALWQARRRIEPGRDPWPFIRRTSVRKAIDLMRRRRPVQSLSSLSAEPSSIGTPDGAPEIDLTGLSRRYRACLVLHFWEGLSVAEIAEQLEVPPGTVKTWMYRARRQLREGLLAKGGCR